MKSLLSALTTIALLGSSPVFADTPPDQQAQATETPAPTTAPPAAMPPAPPANPGAAPGEAAAPAVQPITPITVNGQWTYTTQYGWVYMPYSQSYTYVDPNGDVAYEYAYYPVQGWTWIEAPWVLGWGPRPYWGHPGYHHFAWAAHPWFHVGQEYRGHFAYRTGFGHAHPVNPAYGRHGAPHAGHQARHQAEHHERRP